MSDKEWEEKKKEIDADVERKRKERKNKEYKNAVDMPIDENLEDGSLSMFEEKSTESNKKTESSSSNDDKFELPEFINQDKNSINRNNTEIQRNPPKVLQTIFNFLEIVDNSNAISTIGTIEFTDKLAKLNTVATVCNDEKEGTNLFNQLKETIKFEPLYKSPNTNTGGKTMKRNKGGKRKTMKMSRK